MHRYLRASRTATAVAAVLGATLAAAVPSADAGSAKRPSAASPAPKTGAVARIYVSLPREGHGAPSAALIARGVRTALTDHGSVAGGRPIRLVWLDDARGDHWAPDLVVANARKAAADPSAIAYVGEGNSEASALSMPIVNRAGLAHLSPVATADRLTAETAASTLQPTGIRTFFRPFPSDAREALALVSAVGRSGHRGRVVVVDDGGLSGHSLTSAFTEAGRSTGVRVVARHVVHRDGHDLAAVARAVAAEHPSAIVYGGVPSTNAAHVVRALNAAAPAALIVGSHVLAHDHFAAEVGTAAQHRIRLTAPAAHVDPRAKVGKRLGARPGVYAVFAHNGMTALLHAVDRAGKAGEVTRETVRGAVFDGSVQTGLSGAWAIEDDGDAVYGIYDELRVVDGRIRTPEDEETDRMVRRELAKGDRRAATRTVSGVGGTTSVNMSNIQSMDIETALMLVQAERTKLLDAQLQTQIREVQARNEQVAKLNTILGALSAVTGIVATTHPDSRIDLSRDGGKTDALAAAFTAASIPQGAMLPGSASTWTRSQLDAATATVKSRLDAANNSQQMDMLRLQSMTNKRNEAFDVMTNFVKKMQESRASIIASIR